MIDVENLKKVLEELKYVKDRKKNIYYKKYIKFDCQIKVDFDAKEIKYPEEKGMKIHRKTTCNIKENENFVVLECITSLMDKGYKPEHIELERPMPGGLDDTGGYSDIQVKDNDGKTFIIIECKKEDEFDKYWKKTLNDGGQLFRYYNSYRSAKALCLYTSDLVDNKIKKKKYIISMEDNEEYLSTDNKLKSFREVQDENGDKEDYFKVWKETYKLDYLTSGIFEEEIDAYTVGRLKHSIKNLEEVDNDSIQKKYNEFATILRQHNVGSHENAFDKLVNLFLAKIVDETVNPEELQFYWKGAAFDDYYSLQDRLQRLYKEGMEKFLGEEVTYVDQHEVSDAFHLFRNDPDATKEKVMEYFRKLKFYTNNDFSFLDVHNEELFFQNAEILKKMVQMLGDIKLKTEEQNQFLGDLFEGFLDDGVKQSEGQFFTPLPIVKFLVSSLPLERIIKEHEDVPKVIDYACGAGHFLTEYASCIKPFVEKYKKIPLKEYYSNIYGIEKEYRLSKVSKVSAFMYGQDEVQIIYGDALTTNSKIKDNIYSVLIANPPYSVKGFLEMLTEEERNKYQLYSKISDISKNKNIETFFVERAKQLLKEDGVAAIVLPSTILTNGSIYVSCREILLKYFEIIAIASFGEKTFGKTGENTISIFLRRKDSNPDMSFHYKNRVDAWFNCDRSKDSVFNDENIVEQYCAHVDIDYTEYCEWLAGGEYPRSEIFELYAEDVKKSAKFKKIKDKKICSKYSKETQEKELKEYILSYIKQIESEKLYYYMVASDNRKIVLIQCPANNKEMKEFLGYEWSGAKGNEGIKYLGSTATEEDSIITKNKGIDSIETPLFNPYDYNDSEKINSLIRANYNNDEIVIPTKLESFVSVGDLTCMMNFSLRKFDKSIKTVMPKEIIINTKYSTITLSSLVNKIGGLWKGKKGPFKQVKVIRNTNFTKTGQLDLSEVANIDVSESEYKKRTLEKGDIIVEKSGGSNTQAVGRVVIFEKCEKNFSFSNFTERLRLKEEKKKDVLPEYLHIVLNQYYFRGYTFDMQTGSSGIKNIDINRYLMLPIPIPPKTVQKKIIEKCKKVNDNYKKIRMDIDYYKNEIEKILAGHDVMKENK